MTHPVLLVPGIHGSGPDHWQSRWAALHPGVQRIAQDDWDHPVCGEWVAGIDRAVRSEAAPVVLVAHSLGCLALAHWLAGSVQSPLTQVAAVLMVALPDPDGPHFPAAATGFAPVPARLPVLPLAVWTSSDDPYSPDGFGERTAAAWDVAHRSFGTRGHLNADSGLGDWPEAWAWVADRRSDQNRIGGGSPAGLLGASGAGTGSGAATAGAGTELRGLSGTGAAATYSRGSFDWRG
jgi:predicted alpha/beta hydrolase family esterase